MNDKNIVDILYNVLPVDALLEKEETELFKPSIVNNYDQYYDGLDTNYQNTYTINLLMLAAGSQNFYFSLA